MRRIFILPYFLLMGLLTMGIIPAFAAEMACQRAASHAEVAHGIPVGLLSSISKVESGRKSSGTFQAWPWTINVKGQGYFFDSKAEAMDAVRDLQSHGIDSIDVGCMQINLHHHPDAFASLEAAFDPSTNVDYAARFLNELHEKFPDWKLATGAYHSQTPSLGADYARRVMAIWQKGDDTASFGNDYIALPKSSAAATLALLTRSRATPGTRPYAAVRFLPPARIHQRAAAGNSFPAASLANGIGSPPSGSPPAGSPSSGHASAGRDLASYRSMPVRLAYEH
ncbi:lytic transglycosylase domain-containing protein [Brytella acorum]|uniref:Lytic transglycosylase domain-containing protein n=1 Tax=Brytella acorum TaxID=2959299 RepID=A0AA35Y0M6_9PROT|nr:lytic transglycosylase domain-containing protein [Brytella acorum]MDF3624371.1 lytic transglycosylase domain-containing protein [Brytella acorum]CAI9119779.1 lytic transglycosylase domain-containing protein [Brytella acorum]